MKFRGVAVAIVTASLLLGAVDLASAKPMKPPVIKQYAFRQAAGYNDKNDMRPTRLVLTRSSIDLRGRCNPKNDRNPHFRVWRNTPTTTVSVSCAGRKVVIRQPEPLLDIYAATAVRIGNKVAKSAGISVQEHGRMTLLRVSNRKAFLKFARPSADSTVEAVKTILFRNQGKPKIVKYPRDS